MSLVHYEPASPSASQRAAAWLLTALIVLPMAAPLVWTGYRVALEPHPTLSLLLNAERPLTIRVFSGLWALLAVVGWYALVAWQRRVAWWQALLVLVTAGLALVRLGNVWLLALALLPAVAARLSHVRAPRLFGTAIALGLAALTGFAVLTARPSPLPNGAALAAASAEPSPTVLAAQSWASATQQALGPSAHVLGAGDQWSASPDYWLEYQQVSFGYLTWEDILERRDVTLLVLDAANTQSVGAGRVRASPDWQVIYDQDGALVARRKAA